MNDLATMAGADSAALFSNVFDLLMIVAIGGLWLAWARGAKRQKNVESLLNEASSQLEEASRHLQDALREIQRLQQTNNSRATEIPPPDTKSNDKSGGYANNTMHTKVENDPAGIQPESRPQTGEPADSDVRRIIDMHEKGRTAEQIAAELKIPSARVNLLLRLNKAHAN